MTRLDNVLIVDDSSHDQQSVATLFKRSLIDSTLCLTFASNLTEAKIKLQNCQFTTITLDGLMALERGYNLIPFIKQFQKNPTIIMISDNDDSIKRGIAEGAHFAFIKSDIKKDVKLNENFELVPIKQTVSM